MSDDVGSDIWMKRQLDTASTATACPAQGAGMRGVVGASARICRWPTAPLIVAGSGSAGFANCPYPGTN